MPPQLPSSPDPHARGHAPDDQAIAVYLTAGYGRVLELEAERTALGRRIDELLAAHAGEATILELVREQRALSGEIAALRTRLAEVGATRRPAPEA